MTKALRKVKGEVFLTRHGNCYALQAGKWKLTFMVTIISM